MWSHFYIYLIGFYIGEKEVELKNGKIMLLLLLNIFVIFTLYDLFTKPFFELIS